MRTDREVLKKGIQYLIITVIMMFAGPSLLYVALGNPEKPLYIPLIIISLLICAGAIYMGFKGIRTILDSVFNSNRSD